jgi:hypothetical protein
MPELHLGLTDYFSFYNTEQPHQSLGNKTPNPGLSIAENSTQNLSGKLLLFRAMGTNSQQRVVCIRKRRTLYASLGHS